MDELNKFSKRIKRYTDLGSSAGILAVKFLDPRSSMILITQKMLRN